jgi:hypothetical protein
MIQRMNSLLSSCKRLGLFKPMDMKMLIPDFMPPRCECRHRCTLKSSDFKRHIGDDDLALEKGKEESSDSSG